MSEITKAEFMRYEEVRASGKTNMYHLSNVEALSGLDRETIREIQKRYSELAGKWMIQESEGKP